MAHLYKLHHMNRKKTRRKKRTNVKKSYWNELIAPITTFNTTMPTVLSNTFNFFSSFYRFPNYFIDLFILSGLLYDSFFVVVTNNKWYFFTEFSFDRISHHYAFENRSNCLNFVFYCIIQDHTFNEWVKWDKLKIAYCYFLIRICGITNALLVAI